MAFDPERAAPVAVGGGRTTGTITLLMPDMDGPYAELLVRAEDGWLLHPDASERLVARYWSSVVHHPASGGLFMFGGFDANQDALDRPRVQRTALQRRAGVQVSVALGDADVDVTSIESVTVIATCGGDGFDEGAAVAGAALSAWRDGVFVEVAAGDASATGPLDELTFTAEGGEVAAFVVERDRRIDVACHSVGAGSSSLGEAAVTVDHVEVLVGYRVAADD